MRCTMHFGTPVVPELNSTYQGWSNGNGTYEGVAPSYGASQSDQAVAGVPSAEASAPSSGESSRKGTTTSRRNDGSPPTMRSNSPRRSWGRPAYE